MLYQTGCRVFQTSGGKCPVLVHECQMDCDQEYLLQYAVLFQRHGLPPQNVHALTSPPGPLTADKSNNLEVAVFLTSHAKAIRVALLAEGYTHVLYAEADELVRRERHWHYNSP